uniref:Uncharacterized protein n=1 Tax=Anguilla anguilla TaxID=7936 RepID=A0A0E9UNS8_ANGAN
MSCTESECYPNTASQTFSGDNLLNHGWFWSEFSAVMLQL